MGSFPKFISIPTWYDWEWRVTLASFRECQISIPTWYDWEWPPNDTSVSSRLFQFQHGTIERIYVPSDRYLQRLFQFQHGTIERKQQAKARELAERNFNSNMVRLRDSTAWSGGSAVTRFQFQHGTIQRSPSAFVGNLKDLFQFQHGTIESLAGSDFYNCLLLFQFQHGTIERSRRLFFSNPRVKFQFQHGTIESVGSGLGLWAARMISIPTWYDWEINLFSIRNNHVFISIPTWYDWEALISVCICRYTPYFNSNMVRLRAVELYESNYAEWCISIPTWYDWECFGHATIPTRLGIFQFQHGTIESQIGGSRKLLRRVFQFQHGTIESDIMCCFCSRISYFNSNMVRLREYPENVFRRSAKGFQFQHGTIERGLCVGEQVLEIVFQFQHGTIERIPTSAALKTAFYFNSNMVRLRVRTVSSASAQNTVFQFQHGTIESTCPVCALHSNLVISIPTWYDWEKTFANFSLNVLLNFNSNMVRLRDIFSRLIGINNLLFQFQHGTIESWFWK